MPVDSHHTIAIKVEPNLRRHIDSPYVGLRIHYGARDIYVITRRVQNDLQRKARKVRTPEEGTASEVSPQPSSKLGSRSCHLSWLSSQISCRC
jgi:hypothetical protein